jgi:hypothetical protein
VKFENPSCALRSSNVVLNRLVSVSIFSHGGELTTTTLIINTGKAGVTATYLYRGDPSFVLLRRRLGQVVCRAPRDFPRLLAFGFEASWLPLGPLARKDAGVCLRGVVALVVTLETLGESLAERERGARVEKEYRVMLVHRKGGSNEIDLHVRRGRQIQKSQGVILHVI